MSVTCTQSNILFPRTQSYLCSLLGISALEGFLIEGMSFLLINMWKFADFMTQFQWRKLAPSIPEYVQKVNLFANVFLTMPLLLKVGFFGIKNMSSYVRPHYFAWHGSDLTSPSGWKERDRITNKIHPHCKLIEHFKLLCGHT